MGYVDLKELLKDAKNIAAGANDLQLKSLLLDIQEKVFELQEQNKELRDQINDLENISLIESELEYCNGVYRKGDGVFCSVCWDQYRRLSRVRKVQENDAGNIDFSCDVCNKWRFSNIPWDKVK